MRSLHAITLWRPWPWAMTVGAKRIENRPRVTAERLQAFRGQLIAIHAGRQWDEPGALAITLEHSAMPQRSDDHPTGIVAICRIGATHTRLESVPLDQRRWFSGPYGVMFEDVVPIAPIECVGHQGVWRVPFDVLDYVLTRLPDRADYRAEIRRGVL